MSSKQPKKSSRVRVEVAFTSNFSSRSSHSQQQQKRQSRVNFNFKFQRILHASLFPEHNVLLRYIFSHFNANISVWREKIFFRFLSPTSLPINIPFLTPFLPFFSVVHSIQFKICRRVRAQPCSSAICIFNYSLTRLQVEQTRQRGKF